MKYAVVKDGVVENIIMWDGMSAYNPGVGVILVQNENDELKIGDPYGA
jgi:hypothetical protein